MTMVSRRLASVDAMRAITMLFMIFVNDLISITDVPAWLKHAEEMEDRMGFADTIFPAFLFIVGLSLPFAISNRDTKGHSRKSTLVHILNRSLALLVMGIYYVNYENYAPAGALLPKYWWFLLSTIAFFFVWLDYPRDMKARTRQWLQWTGIIMLLFLAAVYKGVDEQGRQQWMRTHWYGILGLIGWCYLICGCLFFWTKGKKPLLWLSFFFFLAMTIAERAGLLVPLKPIRNFFWIVGSGSLPALTMGGVLAGIIYKDAVAKDKVRQSFAVLLGFGVVVIIAGFILRPYWGLSKIRSTPSWVLLTLGISLVFFVFLAWLMDVKGYRRWADPIKPAGTSTLTCYLLPNIHFALNRLISFPFSLPVMFRSGGPGIAKAMVYSFLIILLTGWLERRKVRLSI